MTIKTSSKSAPAATAAGVVPRAPLAVIWLLAGILAALQAQATSAPVRLGATLPPMEISAGGQVILEGDDYRTAPWSGPATVPMVQVYQYVPGTRKGGSLYDPLTERMQNELDPTQFRITAIVNVDASSGFLKSFVRAKVVDKQRTFTLATMVLDEDGAGLSAWQLEQESAFIVTDEQGIVLDAIFGPPSQADFARVFAVLAERLTPADPI
ncbi:MAG: YtfJ family protein [Cellvibrionales bacterium]|jgi:predicted transcriptional regulator